jgi:hypothetical protein
MDIVPAPRQGALRIEDADEAGIDNPDCTLCPRKWSRGQKAAAQTAATELLGLGIRLGQVSPDAAADSLPSRGWVRDSDDRSIVYEAKRLSYPPDGYKAYPLTSRQVRNLPMALQ